MKKTATADTDVMNSALAAHRRGTEQYGAAATTLMQDEDQQLDEMIVTAQLAPGGLDRHRAREADQRRLGRYIVAAQPW